MTKYVYMFDEGNASMKNLLGGKGANLAEMTNLGLPVPYGFTIATSACNAYYANNEVIQPVIIEEIFKSVEQLELVSKRAFNDHEHPLLVSVRSGSRASMPGMMDTILNLGINDEVVEILAKKSGNERFAYDSYRRFIQMFADVVKGIDKAEFDFIMEQVKNEKRCHNDTDLKTCDLKEIVQRFKSLYYTRLKEEFPQDFKVQLIESIKAVFRSWNNPRAIYYRKMNDLSHSWGTAVNIQMMVFGNMGETSGTGVAFTRNPSTGEARLYGEFLRNAQGEDVVAGIRTPKPISELAQEFPDLYNEFDKISQLLEKHYQDMQDMEFTIEDNKLYMLQTRSGKRTAQAALKIACDLVDEGIIDRKQALMKVEPKQLDALLHPQFNQVELESAKVVARGLPASPGAACGMIVFDAQKAINYNQKGHDVILVRLETSPEDIEGMHVASGILTIRGGMTSHAAVVARGMGKCCVCGCSELIIENDTLIIGDKKLVEGDYLSLDGSSGSVYAELIKLEPATISEYFKRFMQWAKEYKVLKVRTNADTPEDCRIALSFNAEGIGLVRSEHMFFKEERIKAIREMIVSKTSNQRKAALAKILPMQRSDFEEIYLVMQHHPVTIRYLDPPLHEFLPTSSYDIAALANEMNIEVNELKNIITSLHEFNPMMGHRGVRLAISFPEIAQMQTRAIIEAAISVNKKHPEYHIEPEIMIPLVGDINEFKFIKKVVCELADEIITNSGIAMKYYVGTMIEVPRAALLADELAKEADFFSFGTNDLTQMTFGFSRDDAASFLENYYRLQIYDNDPFAHLDVKGVGKLLKMAKQLGRSVKPDIKLGICGEHGGDPKSIAFCHQIGLDYVSCSPYRLPIAYLAAAQAAIIHED